MTNADTPIPAYSGRPDPAARDCNAGDVGPAIIGGKKLSRYGSLGSKVVVILSENRRNP